MMILTTHNYWKITALTPWIFVGKEMSLLFSMLSRFVMGFLGGSSGKDLALQGRKYETLCSILGLRRTPGGGHTNPLNTERSLVGYSPVGCKVLDTLEGT